MPYLRLVACGVVVAATVTVAGCGSSSGAEPRTASLVSSMQASVRHADSVHVVGNLTENGALAGLNLGLNRNGDMSGTVTEGGAPFQVIGLAGKVYVKATPAFLREIGAPAGVCAAVCGKWVELPAKQASQLTGDLSMTSMVAQFTARKLPKLAENGTSSVRGRPAYVLRTRGSVLDVSSAGTPYPLKVVTSGQTRETVVYTQWNAVPLPSAPPAGQVLNLSSLG